MLPFTEFVKSRECKPLVLPPEDEPQDIAEWKRLVKEDQQRQYDEYCALYGNGDKPASSEEVRVLQQLDKLRNKTLGSGVESRHAMDESHPNLSGTGNGRKAAPAEATALVSNSGSSALPTQSFDRKGWMREYMRGYMKKYRASRKGVATD